MIFNHSGIGDILCFYTGVLDWKYANKINKCESKWQYDEQLALKSLSYVDELLENADDVKKLRTYFDYNINVIAKIESKSGLENISEICKDYNWVDDKLMKQPDWQIDDLA